MNVRQAGRWGRVGPGAGAGLLGAGRMGVGGGSDEALHVGVGADVVGLG